MFKRKLFKRALPIILSVAMIFQSMPATALAAESPAQETAADSETLDESTDTVNSDVSDDSASDASNPDENISEENVSEESVSEEKTIAEDNFEERSSEETSLEENTSSESKSEENSSEEKETEQSSPEEDISEETTAPEETRTQVLPDATEEMEGADQKESTAQAAVLIDRDELYHAAERYKLHYDEAADTVFALYDADQKNPFRDILKGSYDEDGEEVSFFYVELDGKRNLDLSKQLQYTWKDAEGKDLAGVPHNAGTYTLEIKLNAIDQVCTEAKTTLSFRIDPRGIAVDYRNLNEINPGMTVQEAVESITEDYQLELTDIDGNPQGNFLNKEAYVASCAVNIVRERFADGKKDGSTLKSEDILMSNEEYSVQLEITLKDKDNYTLSNTSKKLDVVEDIETEIKANTIQADGTNFGWLYGEKPEMETLIKAINPYVVESGPDSEEEQKIADAKLEYQWFDANGKELEEKPSDGTKIPDCIKDAGTYTLWIFYAGKAGQYHASKTAITIVVSTVDVYIGDIETNTKEYIEGTKVENALRTITGYKVYKAGDESKKDLKGDDQYFWGVSYNGDANENTQSYEPVFVIRRGQHVTDKDGKDNIVWDTNCLEDSDSLIKIKKEGDKETTYEYRIEFSGKKAVYGENDPEVDINKSQINYRVDTTAETLAGNSCILTVKEATGPVIDVSEILKNETLNPKNEADKGSLKNPLTKVYDNEPLYNTKNDYKKAAIKDQKVSSMDLTYQWQKITSYKEIVEDDSTDLNIDGSYGLTFHNVEYSSAPKDAGNYRLAIDYTDKETGAVSKTEYVYYTIRKEDILITPQSNVTAYYGESVGSYLDDIKTALRNRTPNNETAPEEVLIDYSITDFTEGVENGKLANESWLLSELRRREKEDRGALTWRVERKITEGDKANSWYELSDKDTFVEGGEYRLTVYADWQAETSSLQNYNNRYKLDFKNDRTENEQTGYEMQSRYADKQSVAITPVQTEGIEVRFEVDWDKITQTTKVYDGEPFGEEMLKAVRSAVTAYNAKTGEPIDLADVTFGWKWTRREADPSYVGEQEAIHAGDYYLRLSVPKGEKYLGQTIVFDENNGNVYKKFVILPSELTVTPVLKKEIKAGTRILIPEEEHYDEENDEWWSSYSSEKNAQNVKNLIQSITISGNIVEADKSYVSVEEGYYYKDSDISYPRCVGYEGMRLDITDKTTGQLMTGYLRGDRSYNVKFALNSEGFQDSGVWNQETQQRELKFYGTDYTFKFVTEPFQAVRDSARVWSSSYDMESIAIQHSVTKEGNSFIHAITPREGIPYGYRAFEEGKQIGGNYFEIKVTAPAEYTDVQGAEDRVIYRNSIENAGEYIIDSDVESDGDGNPTHCRSIIAVFDGAKIAENENGISFEITWEEGFTETFNITVPKTLLMEDLQKAVLPKSLAFNGASTKMAVGEGQQLDLKITKTQMADTICVAYESSDEKVLTVSDSGYVTAIHTGKATVTAYAAYKDREDGKIKPFIDAKGNYAKAAKVNIAVNKVSEVKKIKFEAHDTYAYIDYADVSDGYRREIYVLEGANIQATEFETKINAVQNGNYSAFTAHLFITATERREENIAGKKFWGKIKGLEPNTQYTVYVRNVSALRSFLNGEQIDASEFATAGKPVKLVTTKSQEQELNGYFKTAAGNQPVNGKTSVREDERSAVEYVSDRYPFYRVDISAKSVKFDVEAKYWQKDQENIDYADSGDYIWYPLALTKELQKDYVNPKLTYYVTNYAYQIDESDFELSDTQKQQGYVKAGGYYFLPTTQAASIDKNGKISLKGAGSVYVLAYDAEQDKVSKPVELLIRAAADSVAGKPIKMKVGNTIRLSSYLTYKQGKIKLDRYTSQNLKVEWDDPDNAFTITPVAYEGSDRIKDYTITAKRPTTKPLDLTVHDRTVEANGGSVITIKLSAAALDPVKSLKAYDVYDTEGSIRFDYAGGMDAALKFRIEVKDQTGKILKNQLVDSQYDWRDFVYKNEAYYQALYHHDYYDNGYEIGFREYNAKKNTWTYYYDLENLDDLQLTRQSSYTVSVTAVYDGYDAKTASTKIKTTNIPASKANAITYDAQGKDTKNDGGDEIQYQKNNNYRGEALSKYPLLKSGNTYTLDFIDADLNARNMKTDTLTWKSSNTKVATVKANQGTYTATLKAVKKGTTQITVTSKITKKIVARWTVFVNAVGEADGYFGDNIFQDINNGNLVDKLGADLLTLNNSMTFTLANGEKKWVAFKAPSDGSYSVEAKGGSFIAYNSDSRPLGYLDSSWNSEEMGKGETVYFLVTASNDNKLKKASVTMTAFGTQYIALSLGTDGTKVQGGKTVTFTAPEENVYTFTALDKDGKDVSQSVFGYNNTKRIQKGGKRRISVSGTGEYIVKVTPAELLKDGIKIDLKKGETKYYQFTADEANEYTIYTIDAAENITSGRLYNSNLEYLEDAVSKPSSDTDTNPKNLGFDTRKLGKKEILYIALTAGDKDTTAAFKAEKAPKIGESFTIAQAGGTKTVVYTVDKDGEYRFTADGTKATIQSIEVNDVGYSSGAASWQQTLKKGDYVKLTISAEDANTTITVTCTAVEAITIKAGETAKPAAVTAGLSQKVEFTALENGWYAFNFDKNTVRVKDNTTNDFVASGTEFYAKAGAVRIFTVSTNEVTEQTVNVSVAKATVEKLTNMAEAKTLAKGKTYRYSWTAENEGLYEFTFVVTGATIKPSTEEGTEAKSVDKLSGYYSKGDTFYLTIKTDDSADGSFKAVIAKQDAEELKSGEEKGITVGANASKWISFTSKWSGKVRYQYSKTDADGFEFHESTGLDDDYTNYDPFEEGSRVLRPGQKVYYKVVNNNAEEKTVKLKIAPVLPKEINVEAGTGTVKGTDTIKAGADGWYHFQAAKTSRFDIFVTSKTGDTITDVIGYKVYSDLTSEDYQYNRASKVMEAGKDLYINAANDTDTDTEITVTIIDMEAAATTLELDASGKAEKTLNLKNGVTQYLLFNAKETARYTLTAVDKDKNAYQLPVRYYIDRKENVTDQNTPIRAMHLEAGSTILFVVTAEEDIEVAVTLTKESVTELTNEAVQQTISAGQTLYFRAKIGDRNSRYFIETSEVAEGLTFTYITISGNIYWNNGYVDFVPASGQEEVVFGLKANSTFEGTKTFKIRKGIVTPTPITAGKPAESGELAAYHKVWYSFTPEKAGRYSIKANGALVSEYRNGTNGNGNSISTPTEFFVTDEMAGKEIVYSVRHADNTTAKKVSLSIAEITAAAFGPEKVYTADIAKIEPGEKIWLHFKAENDGRYTFKVSDLTSVGNMQWFKAIDDNDNTSVSKYFNSEYPINAGEEYYIAIPYTTEAEKNFTISVSAVTDSTVETVSVSETAKSFDLKAGETKWLKFTPEKTAIYQFELANTQFERIEQYDRITATESQNIFSDKYAFAAGKTVYFKLTASSSLAEGEKPSIKITAAEDMQTLAEGKNTINNLAENETKYASFTPSETAVYSFELTDKTDCNVWISTDGNSYDDLYSGSVRKYVLDKEHPVYIKVAAYSTASASAEIMIQKVSSVGEIHTGDSKDVTLTSDSNLAFYQFTAEEDGVYIFETDSKNSVYLDASDKIEDDFLDPDDDFRWLSDSYIIELNKGVTRYIRVAEKEDDLNAAGDQFKLTCKKAKEISFTGEDSLNLNLKSGEPVVVRWTAGMKGNYQFGFRVTEGSPVKFKYDNSSPYYPDPSKGVSVTKYENVSSNGRSLVLEASEHTQVEVYAKIVPRSISVGRTETVELDSSKRYEEFNFTMRGNTTYIFCTTEADSAVNSYIIDPDGNRWDSDQTYLLGNDRYWIYSAPSMQEKTYKFRVEKPDSSSDTFKVTIFYYNDCGKYELDSTGWQISGNMQASGEDWYQFNIRETDWYGFGADYSTRINLYKSNGGRLELLGTKEEYSYNKTWNALQEGDIILLQTYRYASHGNGSYSLNVTCDLQQSTDYWTISGDSSRSISLSGEHETVMPLTFSGLNDRSEYTFALSSSYNSENIIMELYRKDMDGNKEMIAEGQNFFYAIEPGDSYELHISNYSDDYWSGNVTAQKEYPYESYTLTLDNNAQEVTVKDGSEARFFFTVPEHGNYLFYSTITDSSYCDNYAELWVNGIKVTYNDDGGDNNQFRINYPLYAGDIVELRTYMYNHNSNEGTYTVHIEKVPEGYNNLDKINISGTSSSTYISALAAGETKKYRFIAPSTSNNNTGGGYLFYSQINTPLEGIELTANVSLASEASAYVLDTVQKDDKGNFYNVAELTPGRPYIFSITNNGSTESSAMNVCVCQYTETDGGNIGGSSQSEPIALNIAAGEENWISYTVAEDGIYTFTVSNPSNSGRMYLYKINGSQITSMAVDSYNDYKSFYSNLNSQSTKSNAVNLTKGDTILLRIYQSSHQELTCNVQASWAVWDITSVENGSNTIGITTSTSNEEGKVWLTFGDGITEGKYTISTTSTSTNATLKLYKDRTEVPNTPDNSTEDLQNNNTVTFEYKPDDSAVYQLGIATTMSSSSIQLTITKETESENPDDNNNDNTTNTEQ